MRTISIAKEFSIYPGGRVPSDGLFSGEDFRENFLLPIFQGTEKVIIDFDGTRGYGSSFLEEAFGGLVRRGIKKEQIFSQLVFQSGKESLIAEVKRYINAAKNEN